MSDPSLLVGGDGGRVKGGTVCSPRRGAQHKYWFFVVYMTINFLNFQQQTRDQQVNYGHSECSFNLSAYRIYLRIK